MPIYEYVCRKCGHELERLQKISAEPLTDCPECGEAALARKISAAGFRLKGGGWYETDFKSSGKKNVAGESSESKADKSDKSATTTDKSDEKTEAKSEKSAKPAGKPDQAA
jgi:putative FmdB family regulatory protein